MIGYITRRQHHADARRQLFNNQVQYLPAVAVLQAVNIIKTEQQRPLKTGQFLQPQQQYLFNINMPATFGFMPVRQSIGGHARQLTFRRFEKMAQEKSIRGIAAVEGQPDNGSTVAFSLPRGIGQ